MRRPNILLITSDQHQATATGCYGNSDVQTPSIDALARSGVRYEYGISNAPVCMAARSVILSGQHNRTCTGGVANITYPTGKAGSFPMPEYPAPGRLHMPEKTLPELLKQNGYHTAAMGKWHIYVWPDVIGFDHYIIPRTHHVHSAQHYVEDGGKEFVPAGWSVEYETSRAIRYIESRSSGEKPFFLYLNYSPPHPPIDDFPQRFDDMYDPSSLTLRANTRESKESPDDHTTRVYRWDYRYYELQLPYTLKPQDWAIRDIYANYYKNVSWLDENIGKVLKALEKTGQRQNTIVVFTADHGDNLGSHGKYGKGLPYDEALRVPMIYSYPERLSPRADENNVASLVDIAPTLLNAASVDIPAHMPGTDVLNNDSDVCISEITPGVMTARSRDFTLYANVLPDEARILAFYDNKEDPYQLKNRAGETAYRKQQEDLLKAMKRHHNNTKILPQPDYGFRS